MNKSSQTSNQVTILMLTYNRARYIREGIESVCKQTYQNWELVIIDDGSTDETAGIVASYADARIRYIHHTENAGLHARRRESLTYVTGEYVAILDSDDYWISPEKLAAQVDYLMTHPECVVVGTQTVSIDATGAELKRSHFPLTDAAIRGSILSKNPYTHSGVLMRTSAVRETQGYQPLLAEDWELFMQLGQYGTFGNLPDYATAHRIHPGSANDYGIRMCSDADRILWRHGQYYPHRWRAHLRSWARLGYSYGMQWLGRLRQRARR